MAKKSGAMCVGGASKRAVGRGIMFSSSQWSHPLQRPQRDQSWGCSQGSRPELRDAGPILADGGSSRGNHLCIYYM
ncbi:hypothetical protein DCAR_0100715 [Daucus carota subsp. sativus]|uniref:Uncharacterized protein n=1 Tax=Daucus carota subsp. sativus TaxID=79200 RepID=A0A162AZX7_DAUCS|nr:hypothetical protein DCAR_0100715 [Daucus carota subsp. sativus]